MTEESSTPATPENAADADRATPAEAPEAAAPNAPATRPMPAGLWPAFWSLTAAGFSFLAAIGAFQHEGPIAILNGGMALACACVNALLTRWQFVRRRGDEHGLARVSLTTFNLLGFAVLCAAGALVVMLSHTNRRGLDFFGDQMIWKEGVRDMALALALVFAVLGVVSWVLRQRLNWSGARYALAAAVLAACTVVFGPTLTIESLQAGEIDQRGMVYKYSLLDMFNVSDEVSLGADSSLTRENDTHPVICIAQETKHFLMFGYRNARNQEPTEDAPSGEDLKRRIAQCDAEVKDALDNGRAVESVLVKGDVDRFLARMRAAPPDMQQRNLVVDIDRLPDPLKSQLTNYLPQSARLNFSAFDVALAVGNKAAAQALMPNRAGLLAHQRQGLFEMGAASMLDGIAGETAESLAEQRRGTYQTMMNLGASLGSVDLMRSAVTSMIMAGAQSNGYADFKGGYSDFDYYLANRHCDVDYAKFLLDHQQTPSTPHLLHLLSIIGVAQYPGVEQSSASTFEYADASLGLPNPTQLKRCAALGAFYGEHIKDFNQAQPGQSISHVYAAVYAQARGAVDQWWSRTPEHVPGAPADADPAAVGDPAIAIETAAAFLKRQPPSFEQYCAWANGAYAWNGLLAKQNPTMTAALRDLPKLWRKATEMRAERGASCLLEPAYSTTDAYETPAGAIKYIDAALAQAGIPCHSNSLGGATYALRCTAQKKPWEDADTASQ